MTPKERRIFAAVIEAWVDAPAEPEVASAVEPLIRRLPASDRRQLRFLLHGIEQGARLWRGRFRRFSTLAKGARQQYLSRWAESRLPLRRQAAAALKTLAMLAYYGREEAWPAVGYEGPWLNRIDVPVLPAPDVRADRSWREAEGGPRGIARHVFADAPSRRTRGRGLPAGITPGRRVKRDMRLRADVCVIGTGAGGAAALAGLTSRGIDAIAVEAGGHPTAQDFDQRELSMLPLLYHNAGLRATADKAIGILQGRGVGGSTLHNTGLVVAPPAAVTRRWRREYGLALSDGALARHVADAVETLGAKPIPDDRINANNDVLRRGARALAWRYSIAEHNRTECCGCGYCMLGCAYNRKTNASLTYIPDAVGAGAGILADAPASRIERTRSGWRIECGLVDGRDDATGWRAEIWADTLVLAAGALNTPALLRQGGLGSRQVGRGLRLHPSAVVGAVFDNEAIRAWRGLPQSIIIEEFASFYDDGHGGYLIIPTAAWPGLAAALTPGLGPPHRRLMRTLPHIASAAVVLHDGTAGRVSARRGRPVARYWPGAADLETLRQGIRHLALLYLAAGADRVMLPFSNAGPVRTEGELERALARGRGEPHRLALNSVHPQGSCPLGADRERSAVDPEGRVWGESNLYVCDASIFPTSVGVPPQVTTMALATAVADGIAVRKDGRNGG